MKVQILYGFDLTYAEQEINNWLAEHSDVSVLHVTQSLDLRSDGITTSIWYSPKPDKDDSKDTDTPSAETLGKFLKEEE